MTSVIFVQRFQIAMLQKIIEIFSERSVHMGNVIASTEQMIEKINDVLKIKRMQLLIL